MKRPVIVVLVIAVALGIAAFALGGVAAAQTGTPSPEAAAPKTPWIGVSLVDLNQQLAARMGLSQTTGVAVASVTNGSPAASAGIKAKDVITAVDGKAVTKASEVSTAVVAKKAGDLLTVTVLRSGKSEDLKVTLGETAKPGVRGRDGTGSAQGSGKDPNRAKPQWKSPLGGLLDGLRNLSPSEAFGRMLGSQWRFLDENNKPVTIKSIPGTVVAAAVDSLTVKPNDSAEAGGPFTVNADTQVRLAGGAKVETLKAGDQVVVVTADGKTALSVTSAAKGAFDGRGGGMMPPHGSFGRGNGGGTKTAPSVPNSKS